MFFFVFLRGGYCFYVFLWFVIFVLVILVCVGLFVGELYF